MLPRQPPRCLPAAGLSADLPPVHFQERGPDLPPAEEARQLLGLGSSLLHHGPREWRGPLESTCWAPRLDPHREALRLSCGSPLRFRVMTLCVPCPTGASPSTARTPRIACAGTLHLQHHQARACPCVPKAPPWSLSLRSAFPLAALGGSACWAVGLWVLLPGKFCPAHSLPPRNCPWL